MLLHLIAHSLLLLFTGISFYFIGKSTGKIKVRADILDFMNETIEKDIEISQELLKIQANYNSKNKPTKEEKEEYQKAQNTFHLLLGRAELFEDFNQTIVKTF